MPSFDIVCEVELHEIRNAVDQANREVGTRYDFKGVEAIFELKENDILMKAEVDFQLQQMYEVLKQKMTKRSVSLKHLDCQAPEIKYKSAVQMVKLKQGVETDMARRIVKMIKEKKCKVQAQIQGDQVRVTGKKRDDLQNVIAMLKEADLDLPLQYVNFRD